jgi:hypothetical protein
LIARRSRPLAATRFLGLDPLYVANEVFLERMVTDDFAK